jgi:hypothetical protein
MPGTVVALPPNQIVTSKVDVSNCLAHRHADLENLLWVSILKPNNALGSLPIVNKVCGRHLFALKQ